MKKLVSAALVLCMLLTALPMSVFAQDWSNGTDISYTAANNTYYTVTVPANMEPGTSGTVIADGAWNSLSTLHVTADETVTLTCDVDGDTRTLDVDFDGIALRGSNTNTVHNETSISVSAMPNVLFGTWTGVFNYNVEMEVEEPAAVQNQYGFYFGQPYDYCNLDTGDYAQIVFYEDGSVTYWEKDTVAQYIPSSNATYDVRRAEVPGLNATVAFAEDGLSCNATINGKAMVFSVKFVTGADSLQLGEYIGDRFGTVEAGVKQTAVYSSEGLSLYRNETGNVNEEVLTLDVADLAIDGGLLKSNGEAIGAVYPDGSKFALFAVSAFSNSAIRTGVVHSREDLSHQHVDELGDTYCDECGLQITAEYVDFVVNQKNHAVFGYTGGATLNIPSVFQYNNTWYKVTTIDLMAFLGKKNITSLSLPGTLRTIYGMSFAMIGIESVEIPASVEVIYSNAFSVSSLTSITFEHGSKLRELHSGAFTKMPANYYDLSMCHELTLLHSNAFLPSGDTFTLVLSEQASLTHGFPTQYDITLIVDGNNPSTFIREGMVYSDYGKTVIGYLKPCTEKHVIIPDGVTALTDAAFEGNQYIERITLPDTLQSIGWSCFYNSSLRYIDIPSSVNSIGSGAVSGTQITSVGVSGSDADLTLPSDTQEIAYRLFNGCQSLVEVDLSQFTQLTHISVDAFYECSNLVSIKLPYYDNWMLYRQGTFVGAADVAQLTDEGKIVAYLQSILYRHDMIRE